MKTRILLSAAAVSVGLCSCCTQQPWQVADSVEIPPPATSVTRQEVLLTARKYISLKWNAQQRHSLHGKDPNGQWVDTPDAAAQNTLGSAMWWQIGPNVGMPYKWGGFDTPVQFLQRLEQDPVVYAGDYASEAKIAGGDDAVSEYAAGVDCSGFVSRCWRLPRPYSTRQLGALCTQLPSFDDLKPGDIALLPGVHVILFEGWANAAHTALYAIEAGGNPHWKCYRYHVRVETLRKLGYKPWRYNNIR